MNPESLGKQAKTVNGMQMIKLLIIGFIVVILMIPAIWITILIHERNERKQSVIEEIASKWGGSQIVSGPFISVPYGEAQQTSTSDGKTETIQVKKYLHIAPDSLTIGGKIKD